MRRTLRALLLAILSFSILVFPRSGAARPSTPYGVDIQLDDGISYADLRRQIERSFDRLDPASWVDTVDKALPLVPRAFFERYVLVYRSRSLQEASFQNPRVVAFGRSARFVLAFNGHPSQRGYHQLEMMQFLPQTQRWEFREISFRPGQRPIFSPANPAKCLQCHQSPSRQNIDPRPNWEPYNYWPGVYASFNKKLKPVFKLDVARYRRGEIQAPMAPVDRFGAQDLFLVGEQAREAEELKRFQARAVGDSRYGLLGRFRLDSSVALSHLLSTLNMQRVARLMGEELGELFEFYKYALWGLGRKPQRGSADRHFSCGPLSWPDSVARQHRAFLQEPHASNSYKRFSVAAELQLIFAPLGVKTEDWSMDFKTGGRFSFGDRLSSPTDLRVDWRAGLEAVFPQDPARSLNCRQLREASETALQLLERSGGLAAALERSRQQRREESPVPLRSRCLRCHVDSGGSAPEIPFDDPTQLRLWLSKPGYPRGTLLQEIRHRLSDQASAAEEMPPSGRASRRQRQDLIQELNSLVAPPE